MILHYEVIPPQECPWHDSVPTGRDGRGIAWIRGALGVPDFSPRQLPGIRNDRY